MGEGGEVLLREREKSLQYLKEASIVKSIYSRQ